MALDRPVHAPETAGGTTAQAVAAPAPLWSAVQDELAHTSPPDFFASASGR